METPDIFRLGSPSHHYFNQKASKKYLNVLQKKESQSEWWWNYLSELSIYECDVLWTQKLQSWIFFFINTNTLGMRYENGQGLLLQVTVIFISLFLQYFTENW